MKHLKKVCLTIRMCQLDTGPGVGRTNVILANFLPIHNGLKIMI
jgi:hypothetical protein